MRKQLCIGLLALVSLAASAEVAPFGQPMGSATRQAVQSEIGSRTQTAMGHPDDVTGVPMLLAEGAGLGIDGLDRASFIFNEQNALVSTYMVLDKGRYADIVAALKEKYPLTGEEAPFVGSRWAAFREGDVVIFAQAKHLSHEMSVVYYTQKYAQLSDVNYFGRSARVIVVG